MLVLGLYFTLALHLLTGGILIFAKRKTIGSSASFLSSHLLFKAFTYFHVGLLFTNVIPESRYHILDFTVFSTLAIAPSFYLYVREYVGSEVKFRKDFIHFLIPLLMYLIYTGIGIFGEDEHITALIQANASIVQRNDFIFFKVLRPLLAAQGLIYSVLSIVLLSRFEKVMLNFSSENLTSNLKWIRQFVYLSVVFGLITIVGYGYANNLTGQWIIPLVNFWLFIVIVVHVAVNPRGMLEVSFDQIMSRLKDMHDTHTSTEFEEICTKLMSFLEEEKAFLNPSLTINDLSQKLATPSYKLSKAINTVRHQTFYDLINSLRVEFAIQILSDPNQQLLTIDRVAADAGFNSRVSFTKSFKKQTGKTPHAFRKTA